MTDAIMRVEQLQTSFDSALSAARALQGLGYPPDAEISLQNTSAVMEEKMDELMELAVWFVKTNSRMHDEHFRTLMQEWGKAGKNRLAKEAHKVQSKLQQRMSTTRFLNEV